MTYRICFKKKSIFVLQKWLTFYHIMPSIVNTRLHCILHSVRNYFKHQSHTRLVFCMQVKPGTPRKRNNRDANTSFSLRGMARGFGSGALLFGSLVVLRINDGLCREKRMKESWCLYLYINAMIGSMECQQQRWKEGCLWTGFKNVYGGAYGMLNQIFCFCLVAFIVF